MGKRERTKLERKQQREELKVNLVYKEYYESTRLRYSLLSQGVWFAIMMLMIYKEAKENGYQFPGFWRLMYIWDDYIPMVFAVGLSWLRHRVTLNHAHLTVVIVTGYLHPAAISLWYLLDVSLHCTEFGVPSWEKYPLGLGWCICLTISRVLRCKTVQAFVGLLTTWVIKRDIEKNSDK